MDQMTRVESHDENAWSGYCTTGKVGGKKQQIIYSCMGCNPSDMLNKMEVSLLDTVRAPRQERRLLLPLARQGGHAHRSQIWETGEATDYAGLTFCSYWPS